MSLSCEPVDITNNHMHRTFVESCSTESLKILLSCIEQELSNRQKEFDNEAHGSEQA
jgi:hypothetical protein